MVVEGWTYEAHPAPVTEEDAVTPYKEIAYDPVWVPEQSVFRC